MAKPVWENISGDWHNQLGSTMSLRADKNGGLEGEYHSKVGNAPAIYAIVGRFDAGRPAGPAVKGVSIGWTVTFRCTIASPDGRMEMEHNARTTTTWSGQYFLDGGERILTHWLMSYSTLADDAWDSTNIGSDTFTRNKPTAAEIAQAKTLTAASPHVEDMLAMRRM
ncbi:tamavidin1 [Mycena polygramma]|nr:tamavidin1 [Mycena polygramma]